MVKVGNTITVKYITEDEDLDAFTEKYGQELIVTDIEDDYLWGVSLNNSVSCPYRIEVQDVVSIEDTEHDLTEFSNYEDVERCRFCGEFYPTYELNKEGYCDNCSRTIEEHE